MGCFDRVFFPCPTCGPASRLEAQSKGGECNLKAYPSAHVPLNVAGGMVGDTLTCPKCKKRWVVDGPTDVHLWLGECLPGPGADDEGGV
jgi:hypothetical protein